MMLHLLLAAFLTGPGDIEAELPRDLGAETSFVEPAAAEGREWKWAVGPRAGYVFPPDADNGTWTAGVQFRYYPWQLLAFETSVDFHKEQHEDGDIKTAVYPVQLSALLFPFKDF